MKRGVVRPEEEGCDKRRLYNNINKQNTTKSERKDRNAEEQQKHLQGTRSSFWYE